MCKEVGDISVNDFIVSSRGLARVKTFYKKATCIILLLLCFSCYRAKTASSWYTLTCMAILADSWEEWCLASTHGSSGNFPCCHVRHCSLVLVVRVGQVCVKNVSCGEVVNFLNKPALPKESIFMIG